VSAVLSAVQLVYAEVRPYATCEFELIFVSHETVSLVPLAELAALIDVITGAVLLAVPLVDVAVVVVDVWACVTDTDAEAATKRPNASTVMPISFCLICFILLIC
jgi:hypothetical protein